MGCASLTALILLAHFVKAHHVRNLAHHCSKYLKVDEISLLSKSFGRIATKCGILFLLESGFPPRREPRLMNL